MRDDEAVDISEHAKLQEDHDSSLNIQNSSSVDSILDELLRNATATCTHTHTCNPPGPDALHTHTCYHTHTHVISSGEDTGLGNKKDRSCLKPRRPLGNKEAVRKYREKRKAHTAYLEEEVKKLKLINQQLVGKLQGQAMVEAEVLRLRMLLVEMRAKIEGELGVFPFRSQCNSSSTFKEGECGFNSLGGEATGLLCHGDLPCLHPQTGSMSIMNSQMNGSSIMNSQMNGSVVASGEGHTMDDTDKLATSATQAG